MYERCGLRGRGSGMGCGVMEWVKRSTLRWFGHIERMGNEEFVQVYLSSVEGPNRRGRPLGRWENRVKEYVSEGKWVGEVEICLPWPPLWGMLLEGVRG